MSSPLSLTATRALTNPRRLCLRRLHEERLPNAVVAYVPAVSASAITDAAPPGPAQSEAFQSLAMPPGCCLTEWLGGQRGSRLGSRRRTAGRCPRRSLDFAVSWDGITRSPVQVAGMISDCDESIDAVIELTDPPGHHWKRDPRGALESLDLPAPKSDWQVLLQGRGRPLMPR
jgi:hypothetical protein